MLTVLTPLITSPILSRALGAEKLGTYSATLAFVSYFTLFAMLGIENYGNRSIASIGNDKEKLSETFCNIYAVQFFSSLLAILAYIISFIFISHERYTIAVLQGLWLLGCLFNINWFFWGTEQFKITVTRSIVIKIITVTLIVIFVHNPDDLYLYALIMAGENVTSNLILWSFLKKNIKIKKPSLSIIKQNILPVFILFIPILAMSVFHIMDKSMLDVLSNETEVGYYYSADKIINIPLGMITALSTVMLPRISNVYSMGQTQNMQSMLKKSTELTLFLTCAVGFGIASIANEFVTFFFGKEFTPCIKLVYYFVPVLFVKALGDLVRSQYMIPTHKDKLYIIAVITGAVVNLFSNLVLITKFSAAGAVLGTLIAESTVTIIEILFSIKEIPFTKFIIENSFYLFSSLAMILGVRICSMLIDFSALLKIVCLISIGGFIYLFLCAVYWKFQKNSIFHSYVSK